MTSALEALAGLPPARTDGAALRASVRAMRAEDGLLLGVLDDDPTGSQSVHGIQIVPVVAESELEAALNDPAAACFVLTNSRSLGERDAAELTGRAARGLLAIAGRRGRRIQLVSRSDSTLRGHLIAEVTALEAVRRDVLGRGFDAVLFAPAFLEAGRLTAADIQWARSGADLVPVSDTEYARDPIFGYGSCDLRDFIAEKARGAIARGEVASISLADIRVGGPLRVCELLAGVRDGRWIVVNAVEYSDLETVASGVLLAERTGKTFVFRTGPSFVRALTGQEPIAPVDSRSWWPAGRPARPRRKVVGSHVGHTSRQVAELRARGATTDIELDVAAIAGGAGDVAADVSRRVAAALVTSDVLVYTSRDVISGRTGDSRAVGRAVSAALSRVVSEALAAGPAWILAKGGITSHEVAVQGLQIRRAEVIGQLFPGMISVFRPIDAAPQAIGLPFVVFAGNVGDDATLADVVTILNGGRAASLPR
jgi:uncharacterized protein YgbK (DUF1537 family)